MSAPIRPLPVEAAPQRTGSDAKEAKQPNEPEAKVPLFGEVLKSRLHQHSRETISNSTRADPSASPPGSRGEEIAPAGESAADSPIVDRKDESKEGSSQKSTEREATPWAILGAQLFAAQVPPEAPSSTERGPSCAQVIQSPPPLVAPGPQPLAKSPSVIEQSATVASPLTVEIPAGMEGQPAVKSGPNERRRSPADRNLRAPAEGSTTSSTELGAALKKLTLTPLEQKIPPAPALKVEQIAAKPAETGEKLRGITVAKQPVMLLNTEKQNSAGSLEQHRAVEVTRGELAAVEQAPRVVRPFVKAFEQLVEFASDKAGLQQDAFVPSLHIQSSTGLNETQHVTDLRAAAVIDSIREHVQIVRISQQNELNVVLRPDAHTELSLQIRHIDGQVHLQARCERGDFTWLDSQWSAVQNALRDQGVRVEPLQAAFRAQDGGSSTWMHDQRGSQQREQRPASFNFEQEISKPRKSNSRPTGSTARPRGWQSWA
jgi:hypothetical protein